MRLCVVQLEGEKTPILALLRGERLAPIHAPPSLRGALESRGPHELFDLAANASPTIPVERVRAWLPPVPDPRTLRDFYAFEQHVKTCRAHRGLDMVPEWYKVPVFYFSNPTTIKGHG